MEFYSSKTSDYHLMVNSWFGWVVQITGIPLSTGFLHTNYHEFETNSLSLHETNIFSTLGYTLSKLRLVVSPYP